MGDGYARPAYTRAHPWIFLRVIQSVLLTRKRGRKQTSRKCGRDLWKTPRPEETHGVVGRRIGRLVERRLGAGKSSEGVISATSAASLSINSPAVEHWWTMSAAATDKMRSTETRTFDEGKHMGTDGGRRIKQNGLRGRGEGGEDVGVSKQVRQAIRRNDGE